MQMALAAAEADRRGSGRRRGHGGMGMKEGRRGMSEWEAKKEERRGGTEGIRAKRNDRKGGIEGRDEEE